MTRLLPLFAFGFLIACVQSTLLCAASQPNIVWIVSEDNSKHYLKLFDPMGAPTPNIDRLAREGLVFDHAFSNAPVCSVARTTLATGVYAPRLATQYHRKSKAATLPAGIKAFSSYLREAGYYATNNSKTDYNAAIGADAWDESSKKASWRNRPKADQPFFHMESHATSHESSLHFSEKQREADKLTTDPASVTLAPYHPDTPLFRYTYARYHDRIRRIDDIVGQTVKKLEEDGLLEDTFVFYFGDHGGVLPRGKGYAYESGLHVPLVIRIPEKWKHLADAPRGTRIAGFVEFVDFGPTAMNLAGVAVPGHMDGKPFLGANMKRAEVDSRHETFGYADRMDEKYELVRTLRDGRWKYHRNYQAHYPDGLQNNYRYNMLAYEEWRSLSRAGQLDPVRNAFFEAKTAEGLYDLETDPHETRNLAQDPAHAQTLKPLRDRLTSRLKAMPDLSFLPEHVMVREGLADPFAYGQSQKNRIAQLIDTADLALQPFDDARSKLETALKSEDAQQRAWALTACAVMGERARPLADQATPLLQDPDLLVRVRAAEFLARIGATDVRPAILGVLRQSDDSVLTLIALNTVVYLRDVLKIDLSITRDDVKARGGEVERRLEYLVGAAPKKRK